MFSALKGFLEHDCDDELAGRLRTEMAERKGTGWDHFEFNHFNLELFHAEDRVVITSDWMDEYDDAEMTVSEFLAALPDVPHGPPMRKEAPRPIPLPPGPVQPS